MKAVIVSFALIYVLMVNAVESSLENVEESFDSRSIDNVTEFCHWINNRTCPDPEVRFYLYTRSNIEERQLIYIDDTLETSNLSSSFFNPRHASKIIIHGFRADMFLTPLIEMKSEYLQRDAYNIFYVDWYNLSSSFCYPAVVHNIKHVGACTAQLVNRIRDAGGRDIHVIGFSLGAQVTNYVANSLGPDYRLPRITGLDPALPLFITSNKAHKLDPSDAMFVDVFHCNGLMQGQMERCGHVDIYMNGGIYQPGCASNGNHILSCSHHRCPNYFMESIRSQAGFYGWKCQSYFHYVVGLCPQDNSAMVLSGEDCKATTRGMFLVKTNSKFPYAKGQTFAVDAAQDEKRSLKWSSNGLSIQTEAEEMLREGLENEKLARKLDNNDNLFLEKLFGADNKFIPKVELINNHEQ